MQSNLQEPLALECLAKVAGISKFHFERVFFETTGTTPIEFLRCLRIERAKELLLSSAASVTDICMIVGYSSVGSFSERFKSWVGVRPAEFRVIGQRPELSQIPMLTGRAYFNLSPGQSKLLKGVVEGPVGFAGPIFIGAFGRGVPQGVPSAGAMLSSYGEFQMQLPNIPQFFLLAVAVPLPISLTRFFETPDSGYVASLRLEQHQVQNHDCPIVTLRPRTNLDPPLLVAPIALLQAAAAALRPIHENG